MAAIVTCVVVASVLTAAARLDPSPSGVLPGSTVLRGPRAARLSLSGGLTLTTLEAHTGTTYNVGLDVTVTGPGDVEIISVKARRVPPGMEQLPAVIGWLCGDKEYPAAAIGADLNRKANYDIRPLAGTRLRAADGHCWYVLLRFVPRRHGTLTARDGEVMYRVGDLTYRQRFAFTTTLEVDRDGPDPRERPNVR